MAKDPSIDREWLRQELLRTLALSAKTTKDAWADCNPVVFTPAFTTSTLEQLQAEGLIGSYRKGSLTYWTRLPRRPATPPPSNATPRELRLEDALKRIRQRVDAAGSYRMGEDIVNIVNEALHE